MPFFRRKKANFQIKIPSKFQPDRSYGSPAIKETVKGQKTAAKTEKKTEREIQSRRGSRPSGRHGGQGPEGRTSPHQGGRPWRSKPEGSLSPLLSRWRRSAAGGTIAAVIVFINVAVFITFLHLFSAVHSPATRCNPLLEHGVFVL